MDYYIFPRLTTDDLKTLNVLYQGNLDLTRGLYYHKTKSIYINLNAKQYFTALSISEDYFISEFAKTVAHECIHSIIDTTEQPTEYTLLGEDKICEILANQDRG